MAVSKLDKEWERLQKDKSRLRSWLDRHTPESFGQGWYDITKRQYNDLVQREHKLARWSWDRMMEHDEPYTDDSELGALL